MRKNRIVMLSLVVLFGLSSTVLAQGRARGRGRSGNAALEANAARVNLLTVPKVQEDLKLSNEQVSKVEAIGEQMRSERQSAFAGGQDLTQEERQTRIAEFQETTKAHAEAVSKLLSKEQSERLDQIVLQAEGAQAFRNEKVRGQLKLSFDQRKKLWDITNEIVAKMQEVGYREGTQEKWAELQKELEAKSLDVLTDEQRSQFAKMLGERIDLPPFAAQVGFNGRRGGGRGQRE